jgi:3-oxoacyl-[acyl-carrier-protein] synthase III
LKLKIKNLTIKNNDENRTLLDLITETGKTSILKSRLNKNKIKILINTGIYKEDHCMEPAYASLIQKSLQINSSLSNAYTFSFDLMNSNIGIFNGIDAIGSLMKTQPIDYAIIISFDLGISSNEHRAVAMILEKNLLNNEGFGKVHFSSNINYLEYDKTYLDLDSKKLIQYKNQKCDKFIFELIIDTIKNYLKNNEKKIDEYKYIILPHMKIEQQKYLIKYLNINSKIEIIITQKNNSYSQTITPFMELNKIIKHRYPKKNDKAFLIQSGSGLIVSCTEYYF